MARTKRKSMGHVTIERVGYRQGAKVLTVCMQWWLVHQELGHLPTVAEYGEFWDLNQATGWRHRNEFRAAWPEFDNPSDLASALGIDLTAQTLTMPATVDVSPLLAT